jgi:hypothetical protein
MEDNLKLWEKIKAGDARALKALHDRYYYHLFLFTRKLFHNNQGCEEAVSEQYRIQEIAYISLALSL